MNAHSGAALILNKPTPPPQPPPPALLAKSQTTYFSKSWLPKSSRARNFGALEQTNMTYSNAYRSLEVNGRPPQLRHHGSGSSFASAGALSIASDDPSKRGARAIRFKKEPDLLSRMRRTAHCTARNSAASTDSNTLLSLDEVMPPSTGRMMGAMGRSLNRQSTMPLTIDDDAETVAEDLLSMRSRRVMESKRLSVALQNMEQDSEHEFDNADVESWAGNDTCGQCTHEYSSVGRV